MRLAPIRSVCLALFAVALLVVGYGLLASPGEDLSDLDDERVKAPRAPGPSLVGDSTSSASSSGQPSTQKQAPPDAPPVLRSIRGVVLDAGTRRPVEDAAVSILDPDLGPFGPDSVRGRALSGADGSFVVEISKRNPASSWSREPRSRARS